MFISGGVLRVFLSNLSNIRADFPRLILKPDSLPKVSIKFNSVGKVDWIADMSSDRHHRHIMKCGVLYTL